MSAATQNQALAARLFLYGAVLGTSLPRLAGVTRARRPRRLPTVLTRAEVRAVLACLDAAGSPNGPPYGLVALLLYGAGLRLLEALRLRIKDVDLARGELAVRSGKGGKDRVTVLPTTARRRLEAHLARVRALHAGDLAGGAGRVALPGALARKLPSAAAEWGWQWVFPATSRYVDQATGERRRHHLHETAVQRAVRDACGAREAHHVPHLPAQLRHAPVGGGIRHPDRAGAPRAHGRADDDELHARAEPGRAGGGEPGGPDGGDGLGGSGVARGRGRLRVACCRGARAYSWGGGVRDRLTRGRIWDGYTLRSWRWTGLSNARWAAPSTLPMSTIPEDRPLTADEYALTHWLLTHGGPEAAAHLGELDRARVVGRCGCGCASIDFTVDGREAPQGATFAVLDDYQWRDAAGHLGGVFVFARAGVLAGLEVWSVDGEADTTRLPAPDALEPLGTPPAT